MSCKILSLGLPLSLVTLMVSCGSPAKRIETGGPQSITTTSDVDDQDINEAANAMLASLLELGTLRQAPQQPAVLLIDRITNDTTSDFPIDNLVYAMREQLVNSGQAAVNTTYGSNAESKLAQDEAKLDQFETGERTRIKNDFALTGRITELRRSAGNVRQSTFTFRLTLTATSGPRKGLEVWTKQAQFTKQGTKASVGR
jgi:PBP1b-binding outer membrane lipoprotein LpoB